MNNESKHFNIGDLTDFRLLIILAIHDNDLTQRELANKAHVTEAMLSRFLTGKRGITLSTACKLVKALNIKLTLEV